MASDAYNGAAPLSIPAEPVQHHDDDPCPICLEEYSDKAFVKACFHAFCFICIVQWSEITQTCPICKASFQAVIHNVKNFDDYTTFSVGPSRAHQEVKDETNQHRQRLSTRQSRNKHVTKSKRKPASEARRKAIYVAGLRAQPPCSTDKVQRVRDISLLWFRKNPAAIHRLLPWISRDIKVLLGEDHIEFLVQLIISMLDKVNIDSSEFIENIRPFLGDKTDHFVHELIFFAKSPLDMVAYDDKVCYDFPTRSNELLARMDLSSLECSSMMSQQHDHDHSSLGSNDQTDYNEFQKKILFELCTSDMDNVECPPINSDHTHDDLLIECSSSDIINNVGTVSHHKVKGKGKGPLNRQYQPKVPPFKMDMVCPAVEIISSEDDSVIIIEHDEEEIECLSPEILSEKCTKTDLSKLKSNVEESLPEISYCNYQIADTKQSKLELIHSLEKNVPSSESREFYGRKRHKRKHHTDRKLSDKYCVVGKSCEKRKSRSLSDEVTRTLQDELQCINKELDLAKEQLRKAHENDI